MRPVPVGLATVFAALLLSGCAAFENRELERVEHDAGVHVVEVMTELHLAIAAIDYFVAREVRGELIPLVLEHAQATLITTHVGTGDERVALILPAAGGRQIDAATSTLILKLSPDARVSALSDTHLEAAAHMQDLAALYADAERTCAPTGTPATSAASTPGRHPPLWEAIAHVAMSALVGYQCARERTGDAGTRLGAMSLEIDVSAERDETGGLLLTIGQIGIGASESEDGRQDNKLLLQFKAP